MFGAFAPFVPASTRPFAPHSSIGQRSQSAKTSSSSPRAISRSLPLLLLALAVLCMAPVAQAGSPLKARFIAAQSVVPSGTLSYPYRVAVDAAGNVYIADTQANQVLKETLSNGIYSESVIVSTGLATPYGVAVDSSGNVYIADNGHNRVLMETPTAGGYTQSVVTTTATLSFPTGVAVDSSGTLYIADTGGGKILKEVPSGGSFTETVLSNINLAQITGITVDQTGNIFASDIDNQAVYEFAYSAGSYTFTTIPTSGLNYPYDITVDPSGNLYISDFSNKRIVEEVYNSPGTYTQTTFPSYNIGGALGIAADAAGNLYLADTFGFDIKKLTLTGGAFASVPVTSGAGPDYMLFGFAGGAPGATLTVASTAVQTQGAAGLDFSDSTTGNCAAASYSAGDTCAIGVNFSPQFPGQRLGAAGLVGPAGWLAYGYIQGIGTGPQINFSPAVQASVATTAAPFNLANPFDAAFDASGNVYIADYTNNAVYMETFSAGSYTQTTIASGLSNPEALAVDGAGNLFIVDSGNNQILEVTNVAGVWSQTPVATGLNFPTGIAVDGLGNLYFSSFNDGAVYQLTPSNGGYNQSTLVTGLNQPRKIAIDANGNLYIADTGNSRILLETNTGTGYTQSVIGSNFLYPYGVAVGPSGNVYVADTVNHQIVEETLSAGSYTQSTLISGPTAYGVQVDQQGRVYISDANIAAVSLYDYSVAPGLAFANTLVGSTSTDSPQAVTVQNIGNADLAFAVPSSGNNPSVADGFSLTSGGAANCPLVSPTGSAQALPAGAACTLPVSFTPEAVGVDSGSLSLVDNSLNASSTLGNTQAISLSGRGLPDPTTTAASAATATFSASVQSVTLSAAVTSTTGTVDAGTVTFTLLQGSTPIGSPVTSATLTSGSAMVSYTLPAATPAGAYTIQAVFNAGGAFDTSSDSYQTLTIGQVTPTVTWATPAGITYGVALTSAQLNVTPSVPGTVVYSPAAGAVLGAGSQTLSATFTPADPTDYASVTQTVSLSVAQASLTITTTDASVAYNQPIPAFTFSPAGFVNGDSSGVLSGAPAESTTATQGSVPNTYPITISQGTLSAVNYTFTFQPGTLTITTAGAAATPSISPAGGIYHASQPVTLGDTTPGAIIYYTTNGQAPTTGSAQYTTAITVGASETIQAIAVATGYTQSAVGSAAFTVATASSTVTVTPSSASITDAETDSVTVTLAGTTGQPTPTGQVVLTGGSYSDTESLVSGVASFTIPAGALVSGANTLTAAYTGDSVYGLSAGTATVTIAPIEIAEAVPTTPVAAGVAASGSVTISTGSSYSGTIDLTCTLTTSPSGAQSLPTCAISPATLPLASGANGSSTVTVSTTAASTTAMAKPAGSNLFGFGGGLALAGLLMFGISARRRRWLSMLALLLVTVGAAAIGCGGSAKLVTTVTPATTSGSYIFTLTGTDSVNSSIVTSTTFTVTVQ